MRLQRRDGGNQRAYSGGDADGGGKDVIGEQGRGREQTGKGPRLKRATV